MHLAPEPLVAKVGTSHFRDASLEALASSPSLVTCPRRAPPSSVRAQAFPQDLIAPGGLLSAGLWHSPAGLIVGTAVFALGIALFTPALMTLAVEGVSPSERGAVIGTTSAFLDLAFGLGPATLGFVSAGVGRGGTFVVGAGVAIAGLGIVLGSRLGRTRPTSEGRSAPQGPGDGRPERSTG